MQHSKSNPAILNEARDYIDGLLLADGSIPSSNRKHYTHSCKHKSWLSVISNDLFEYGIICGVDDGTLRKNNYSQDNGSTEYHLWTYSYSEFKMMHDRWYIKWYDIDNYPKTSWHKDKDGEYYINKKIIPKDIILSQVCVANLYLGDGSISNSYRNCYNITLSTEGFLLFDVIFLAELISDILDIKLSVCKDKRIVISTQSDIKVFLNYIKDYKVDCYDYKFPMRLLT